MKIGKSGILIKLKIRTTEKYKTVFYRQEDKCNFFYSFSILKVHSVFLRKFFGTFSSNLHIPHEFTVQTLFILER